MVGRFEGSSGSFKYVVMGYNFVRGVVGGLVFNVELVYKFGYLK